MPRTRWVFLTLIRLTNMCVDMSLIQKKKYKKPNRHSVTYTLNFYDSELLPFFSANLFILNSVVGTCVVPMNCDICYENMKICFTMTKCYFAYLTHKNEMNKTINSHFCFLLCIWVFFPVLDTIYDRKMYFFSSVHKFYYVLIYTMSER